LLFLAAMLWIVFALLITVAALIVGAASWPRYDAADEEPPPDGDKRWHSAGGLVINDQGKVALVLQRDRANRLRWTLPKGRVDAGERVEEAALREVYEESGLAARIVRPILVHEGPRHYTHYYEMKLLRDDDTHDRETKKVRFVRPAKALRLLRSKRDVLVVRMWEELRCRPAASRQEQRLAI
jgi:ADP-ribose pyrophosphatase YjhB (NUDIX family)